MSTYEIVCTQATAPDASSSSFPPLKTQITEQGKGGVRTLCLCNYEDAQRIKQALELYDDFGMEDGR